METLGDSVLETVERYLLELHRREFGTCLELRDRSVALHTFSCWFQGLLWLSLSLSLSTPLTPRHIYALVLCLLVLFHQVTFEHLHL
ncbi:hypothetical protein BDP55DRAFT_685819 [Colletotrichum godetiae]|uniref:Uncharacterized protein n=1 Tax=Colletotrichum godetiae TaxID=1209918 RepID=A0AAJ0EQE4_9PEZI|nr:uncharacterized protein BDP55DRAFT_685819 [Colletotrichum godetiae]KAK1657378.1 hypothetical protein BDP55DRAFT_685819 [Colletotrichum godetiae]